MTLCICPLPPPTQLYAWSLLQSRGTLAAARRSVLPSAATAKRTKAAQSLDEQLAARARKFIAQRRIEKNGNKPAACMYQACVLTLPQIIDSVCVSRASPPLAACIVPPCLMLLFSICFVFNVQMQHLLGVVG